jgi:PAS domain S-box-containing protein
MQFIVRKWLDSCGPLGEADAEANEASVPATRIGRQTSATPAPAPATHVVAPKAPSIVSPAEQRLKLIIESAPVSLMVVDRSGQVLAANRAALAIFGAEQTTAIVGRPVGSLVAPDNREAFETFVAAVCGGKPGSLEFDVLRPDGSRRKMETHAVAIRRGEDTPPAFLGVTRDVTETLSALQKAESQCALVEAERDALKEALEEANRTAIRVDGDLAEQERLKAALAEIEDRQAQRESVWAAERESLTMLAQKVDDRLKVVLAEAEDRLAQRESAWTAERESLAMRAQKADEQLKAALAEAEARQKQRESSWASERESLTMRAQKAEEQQAALARELLDQRQHVEMLLADADRKRQEALASAAEEGARLREDLRACAQLLAEREQWRPALASIVRTMTETCEQAKRLIDDGPALRVASSVDQDQTNTQYADVEASAEPESDHSWQF